jgi:hypothetical protein
MEEKRSTQTFWELELLSNANNNLELGPNKNYWTSFQNYHIGNPLGRALQFVFTAFQVILKQAKVCVPLF